MEEKNIALLKTLLNAVNKCITIYEEFDNIKELKENKLIFDNLISNLVVIYESDSKLDNELKTTYNFIEWYKIDSYKRQVMSDYHELDTEIILEILTTQLPVLKEKLEKLLKNI